MQREIVIDAGGLWYAKGQRVEVDGLTVTGQIWTGTTMRIAHDPDDMRLLLDCSAPVVERLGVTKNSKSRKK